MIQISPNIKSLLEKSNVAFATCDKNLIPNCVIVACVKVINDNQVLFTDNYFHKTRDNLDQNPNVSLSFCSTDGNEAYQIKGSADVITDGEYKEMVDSMECNQGLAHKAAILITISEIWDLADPKLICSK